MRRISIMDQLKVLFRGTTTLIGAGLLAIFLLLSLFTLDSTSLKTLHFIGKETPIMAHITTVIPQEGKSRVLYLYTVDKKTYSGDFYTTENIYQAGNYIEVEYAKGNPKYARLLGEKTDVMVMGTGIVFLIALLFISLEFKQNVTMWVLIKWGRVTRAALASKERGKKEDSIVIFRYKDHSGDVHELTEKTAQPENFSQHVTEYVVYLPKRPKTAVLVSKIPPEIMLYDF